MGSALGIRPLRRQKSVAQSRVAGREHFDQYRPVIDVGGRQTWGKRRGYCGLLWLAPGGGSKRVSSRGTLASMTSKAYSREKSGSST